MMTMQPVPNHQATNAYPQQKTTASQPREAATSGTSATAHPTAPAPVAGGSASDAFFRNAGATLKGATSGFGNLVAEPFRKVWNYSKEGTPQALAVAGGTVALAYGAVVAASAGTLFPILAGGLALGAGIQLFRGGYGAFSAENPKDQLKGFGRVGQAITLSVLAGASALHYKHFWHAPAWDKLLPTLGKGIKEISTKGFEFVKTIPKQADTAWTKTKTWVGGVKDKAVDFWKNLTSPKTMP
ncbi:MAG: hypothetical protein H2174_04190 [Vampirovibrio sp.]|nr:hypothetical protein [Vampirovibrio sp.]